MAQLEIKNLSFGYPMGGNALKNINLSVGAGEFLLIAGASGCGKTTLLRHIKPCLRPCGKLTGEVLLDGVPVSEMSFREQSGKIGFVMQDPEMQIISDKVWREMAFGVENLGADMNAVRVRIAETACFFGIQDWFEKDTSTLSGGQKQLLCLASVMAMRPEIILLDEPASQLDPIAASGFFDTLKRVNTELGATIIITEHRTENLFPIADRAAFMRAGEIVLCCKPGEAAFKLKTSPYFDEFYPALPAAARLYCAVESLKSENAGENINKTANGASKSALSPVSCRDGREYLKNLIKNPPLIVKSDNAREETPPDFSESQKPVISLKDVWFRYESDSEDVLKGLCLDIPKNKLTCVIGGNGAGKSTALLTAAGVYKPYRGSVKFAAECFTEAETPAKNGESPKNRKIRRGKMKKQSAGGRLNIAVLTQESRLYFNFDSVRAELENTVKKYGLNKNALSETARLMEIENILDCHPYDISGGESRRAAIAKLLLRDPKVLFLDEATKGMDANFKLKFGALLKKLVQRGMTVVLVSHDIEFCAEFADNCVLFFNGGAAAQGTPKRLFSDNSFYTTAANRISRGIVENAVGIPDILSAAGMTAKSGARADKEGGAE